MTFNVEWMINTNIKGIYRGTKTVEAFSIEQATSKCKDLVAQEFSEENRGKIKIINVWFK